MANVERDRDALGFLQPMEAKRWPATLRYETEDMAQLRILLHSKCVPDDVIDNFKRCLNILTREGFSLKGPDYRKE
jgi:hypothetical protein